jgi:hypothetical protein
MNKAVTKGSFTDSEGNVIKKDEWLKNLIQDYDSDDAGHGDV